MFGDIRNTGDDHWFACSGIAPSQEMSLSCGNSVVNLDDEDDEDSDKELETPTSRERGERGMQGLLKVKQRSQRQAMVVGYRIKWAK
jgi:hypothetical protein